MSRTNIILIAVLVVQVVISAVVFWPRAGAGGAGAESLLGEVSADDIVGLTVQDNEGNRLRLTRQADQWVLPDAGDYPVQADRVAPLLDKLAALKSGRLVTQTAASHKRLQVAGDDFMRRIDVETAGGKTYTLFLGSSPQARATHVRLNGDDNVYLAADLASFDANVQPSGYVDTAYLTLPAADMVSLTVQNANGELTLEKDAEGNWQLADLAEGETMDAAAASTLANRISSVRLTRPLGAEKLAEYALDSPAAVVIVTTQSGEGDAAQRKTITLQVGAQDPADNSYVVSSSESPYFVRVAEFAVQDFVEKARGDFLARPDAAATPAAGP